MFVRRWDREGGLYLFGVCLWLGAMCVCLCTFLSSDEQDSLASAEIDLLDVARFSEGSFAALVQRTSLSDDTKGWICHVGVVGPLPPPPSFKERVGFLCQVVGLVIKPRCLNKEGIQMFLLLKVVAGPVKFHSIIAQRF